MTNNQIIQEAVQKGYLKASRIKPAHLTTLVSEHHPVLLIPEGADLYFKDDRGDLYLRYNYKFYFEDAITGVQWGGVVYNRNENRWSEIVAYHSPSKPLPLRDFPQRGVCWNHNKHLFNYLKNRDGLRVNPNLTDYDTRPPKGLAWGLSSCWGVSTISSQPEYDIDLLKPFIVPIEYPLTLDECFPPNKWYILVNEGNQQYVHDFLRWKQNEYKGYNDNWKPDVGVLFCYPQISERAYNTTLSDIHARNYVKITTDTLISFMSKPNECYLPLKWCIKTDRGGEITKAVRNYANSNGLNRSNYAFDNLPFPYYYISPNRVKGDTFNNASEVPPGYTLITFEYFKKYILTNKQTSNNLNNKEDERQETKGESIKVQRSNLIIRDTEPIRASGLKCAESKIQIRDGYSTN